MGELVFEPFKALIYELFIIEITLFCMLIQNELLDLPYLFTELHVLEVQNSMDNFVLFVLISRFPLLYHDVNDLLQLIFVVLHFVNYLSFLRFVPSLLQVIRFYLLLKVAKNTDIVIFLFDKFFLVCQFKKWLNISNFSLHHNLD